VADLITNNNISDHSFTSNNHQLTPYKHCICNYKHLYSATQWFRGAPDSSQCYKK